jgi:choline-sulfatase
MKRAGVALVVLLVAAGCARGKRIGIGQYPLFPGAPVIMISIDTLRADHLPAWGYRGVETPAIDALRRDSILYKNAYSQVPLTLPSHVAMLTGLLPADNGVRNNIGYPFDSASHATIPSILKEKGYDTGAAVSAYVLRGSTGLASAFDFYDDAIVARAGVAQGELQRSGDLTAAIATKWVATRASKPFFFLLHLFEPHAPYDPPEPFRSRYALKYDGEIATADAIVGRFIDNLKRTGIYDRAVIILMSDHGEGLGQHGEPEHGILLYREDIHVPLLVKLPGRKSAGTTVDDPVQLIDILPTVAALTGARVPGGIKGTSLLSPGVRDERRIFSETLYPRIHLGWSELRSLIGNRYHYIEGPGPEIYDEVADPAEKTNRIANQRRVYARMRVEMSGFDHSFQASGPIDPVEAKKLSALGYLSARSTASEGSLPDPKDHIGEIAMLSAASSLNAAGRTDEAIAAYRDVLAKNPRFADAWILLSQALDSAGRYEEAIEARMQAIAVSPSLVGEASLSIAAGYLSLGQPDQALPYAELAMRTHPARAHLQLGYIALARRDWSRAEQEARPAMDDPGSRAESDVLTAQALTLGRGKYQEALALLDKAERERLAAGAEAIPSLEYARGDALARMNRVEEAKAAFRREIRQFPRNEKAYADLAVLGWLQGNREEARQTMEQMVRSIPTRQPFLFAARTFEELGDHVESERWRRRAGATR